MAIKRDKLDAIFSNLVRERSDWTCDRCGKYYPEGMRQGLHASHLYTRANKSTRWFPPAVVAHCYPCHQWYGGNPIEGARWAEEFLGEGMLQIIRERAHTPRKYTKVEREEMYAHYKQEHELMLKKRKQGVIGRIEFVAFD